MRVRRVAKPNAPYWCDTCCQWARTVTLFTAGRTTCTFLCHACIRVAAKAMPKRSTT